MGSSVSLPLVTTALRKTRAGFLSVAAVSAATNVLMLVGPLFMLQVYDRVLPSRSVPTLLAMSLLAIGLYVFLGLLEVIRARILTQIGQRLEEELGAPTFAAVLALPLRSPGKDAASQPLRDLDHIRQFMAGPGPVAICDMPWLPFYLAVLFLFHPYLGWLAVGGALFLIILTLVNEAMLRGPAKRLSQMATLRGEFVEAGRRNAEALHAMGMGGSYQTRWQRTNSTFIVEQRRSSDASSGFATISKIFRIALQSAVLGLGAWLVIRQLASSGVMIAASILTSRALAPIEQAISQWRGFVNARQAAARLRPLLEQLRARADTMPLPLPRATLSVGSLTVAPPGTHAPTIQDIGFALKSGQAVGVIGPSGSGKSTLARALVGIWRPMRGTVRLDGAQIDQWDPQALGHAIGYLPQGVELFDGTVAENIGRFMPEVKTQDIIEAVRLAGVHDLILGLPDGYDTQIGVSGAVLSAGQRQRVGLARALFCNPFLVVLDEPNASLDAEGEVALTGAIAAMRDRGSIVVVIAHRPNALAAVDHVLYLAQGRVAAFGPRDEVLRKSTIRAVGE